MKKAEKKKWRGDFFRGRIFISQNIFSKKKNTKRDKSRYKKGFLKTLNKGGKENENKKKEKIGRNLEKQTRFAKSTKRERKQRRQ